MLHAANIVPQIGKARSKSGFETVSYQITLSLRVPNWEELHGQSEPRTGRAVYRRKIFADQRTKPFKPGGVIMRVDPPDRNGRH